MTEQVVYVFLTQRPQDSQPWPNVYQKLDLAEAAGYRLSDVVPVKLVRYDGPVNIGERK